MDLQSPRLAGISMAHPILAAASLAVRESVEDVFIEAYALRFNRSLIVFPCSSLRMSGVGLERTIDNPNAGDSWLLDMAAQARL